jgi:hypothetical protein
MMGRRPFKPMREMLVVYRRLGQLMWGRLMNREVGERGKKKKERKYRTERGGRSENLEGGSSKGRGVAGRLTRGRSGRVGRPPRVGFGGKLAVYSGRLADGVWRGERRELEMASLGLARSVVGALGYLRRRKRRWMPAPTRGKGGILMAGNRNGESRGVRSVLGRRTRRGWRNGGGLERRVM